MLGAPADRKEGVRERGLMTGTVTLKSGAEGDFLGPAHG